MKIRLVIYAVVALAVILLEREHRTRPIIGVYNPDTGAMNQHIKVLYNEAIVGVATDYVDIYLLRRPRSTFAPSTPSPYIWHLGRLQVQVVPAEMRAEWRKMREQTR